MIRATGRLPHSPADLERLASKHRYLGAVETVSEALQPIGRIRDQLSTPSCVGQACAGGIEALLGFDASAIDIWIDARRRQGDLGNPLEGTTVEFAVESMIHRGISPYEPGEEDRPIEEYTRQPALADELEADDERISPLAERFLVLGTVAQQRLAIVRALLSDDHVVLWATGVRDSFSYLGHDELVTLGHIGADVGGHQMRIVGYDPFADEFLGQNSWGLDWGGCIFRGVNCPGCFRMRAATAITAAWDTMILQLKRS